MMKDKIYLLTDGDTVQAFGNLMTLLVHIDYRKHYTTVWRLLNANGWQAEVNGYKIKRVGVIRGPYAK